MLLPQYSPCVLHNATDAIQIIAQSAVPKHVRALQLFRPES